MEQFTFFEVLSVVIISFLLAVISYLLVTLVMVQIKYINPVTKNKKDLVFSTDEKSVLKMVEFHDKVNEKIRDGTISDYAYIVIDIDDFKMINKLYGEIAGDELLAHISKIIKKNLRSSEIYTRVEADIFAVFLKKDIEGDIWYGRAENIINSIMQYHKGGMEVIPSMGIYDINCDVDCEKIDLTTINTNAYLAKRMVKGHKDKLIYLYGNNETEQFIDKKKLLKDFKKGIEHKEFKIYLQAQKDIRTSEVRGAEILVRWKHKDRGIVTPKTFIGLFEETGDIIELDLYVFEETCKMISESITQGLSIKNIVFSVNVSRNTFIQPYIALKFAEIADRYSIGTDIIELEITESSFLGDSAFMSEQVSKMREQGFSIAIDDFGSGYSSLNVLKDMDINTLKLDKVFLEDELNKGSKSTKIIEAIISLSKDLGLKVIVEGIETESQRKFLETTGCDIGQGYYFARPIVKEEFCEKYLTKTVAEEEKDNKKKLRVL